MKINKRGTAAVIVGGLVAATIAIGAPAHADANTVTLWADSLHIANVKPSLDEFASANGITITYVTKGVNASVRDQVIGAKGKDGSPDIVLGAHDWIGSLVAAGEIAPVALGAQKAQLVAPSVAGVTYQKQTYGVPMWTENIAVVRNTLKASKAPKTFAELTKGGALEIQSWSPNGDAYHYQPLLSSFGLAEYSIAGGGWIAKSNLGGANGAAYAKFLAKNKNVIKGAASSWDQLRCALLDPASPVKYWISGPWAVSNLTSAPAACKNSALTEAQIAIDPIPSAGGKKVSQFLGVQAAFKTVDVAAHGNAVAVGKVLSFLGSSKAGLSYNAVGNVIPANADALAASSSDKFIRGFAAAGKNAVPMPAFAFQQAVFDKIGLTERNIITGKSKNPAKDWAAAAKAITALVKASNK
jgi:arabinogalactan oligomer/maltooligosaccharide transport system substrate-binding protein